jgi:hypothetical protein
LERCSAIPVQHVSSTLLTLIDSGWHRVLAKLARWILGRSSGRVQGRDRAGIRAAKETTMTTQTNPDGTDPNSVWKVMNVQAPPAVAWRVFTEMMGTWWPVSAYKIGKTNAVDAIIEPRVGAAGTSAATMEAPVTGAA